LPPDKVAFFFFVGNKNDILEEYLTLPPNMPQKRCPYCDFTRFWKLRRNKKKCKKCRREYSDTKYPVEGFWGILKRKLGCIGGMRRERLPLFVAEIVWKFNHRKMPLKEREVLLYNLISKSKFGGRN